jgi:hypothetical protein
VHDVATVALTANVPVAVAAAWLLTLKAANTEATARPNTRWENFIGCFDFMMLPLFSFQMNVTRKVLAITHASAMRKCTTDTRPNSKGTKEEKPEAMTRSTDETTLPS